MLFRLSIIFIFGFLFLSCTGQEPRWPIQTQSGSFIKESATRNKKLYEEERDFIEDFIEKDSTHTYYASEKGFWYFYNKQDTTDSKTPEFGDGVRFSYDIRDFNGDTILSEKENGIQHYKIDQSNQDLISGIRDGIKLMKAGEEVTFLFPSYKAYGYYGIEAKLGTNIPVKSTVKLYAIETKE
jgi:gliding motility-associated peptidyl-prolyl isomerase